MEIITGVERRRRWRPEEKRRVLAELEAPDATVAEVARRHDISRGLLWTWRRQARRRLAAVELGTEFLPVHVTLGSAAPTPVRSVKPETSEDSAIEIRLTDGTTIRVKILSLSIRQRRAKPLQSNKAAISVRLPRLHELLPWHWRSETQAISAA